MEQNSSYTYSLTICNILKSWKKGCSVQFQKPIRKTSFLMIIHKVFVYNLTIQRFLSQHLSNTLKQLI